MSVHFPYLVEGVDQSEFGPWVQYCILLLVSEFWKSKPWVRKRSLFSNAAPSVFSNLMSHFFNDIGGSSRSVLRVVTNQLSPSRIVVDICERRNLPMTLVTRRIVSSSRLVASLDFFADNRFFLVCGSCLVAVLANLVFLPTSGLDLVLS